MQSALSPEALVACRTWETPAGLIKILKNNSKYQLAWQEIVVFLIAAPALNRAHSQIVGMAKGFINRPQIRFSRRGGSCATMPPLQRPDGIEARVAGDQPAGMPVEILMLPVSAKGCTCIAQRTHLGPLHARSPPSTGNRGPAR
jgi:hypothetical protein